MQAKLSSFISSRRPRKKARNSKAPFGLKSFESAESPHPYASPEVLNIGDYSAEAHSRSSYQEPPTRASEDFDFTGDESFSRPTSRDSEAPLEPQRRAESPRVQLEINFSPEPLQDLLPAYFLNPDTDNRPDSAEEIHWPRDGNGATLNKLLQARTQNGDHGDANGEGGPDSSDEDLVANLKSMDASSFVNGTQTVNNSSDATLASIKGNKKQAPAPISIPNPERHGPQVEVVRSPTQFQYNPQSRPISATSLEEASSVSGTTLARQLLANTFVLSNDRRTSRYRSGGSVLTRSDSATLPRGDHPLLNSPYGPERSLSANGDILSADLRKAMKPVPPVPQNAEQVYVPPSNPRETGQPIHAQQTSTEGQTSPNPSEIIMSPTSLIQSVESEYSQNATSDEANTADPAKPSEAGPMPASATSAAFDRGDDLPTDLPVSSASDQPSPGQLVGEYLEYYDSPESAPPPGEFGYKPAFSPITEETGSQLSPPTPTSNRGSRLPLSATPSSSSLGSRINWSPSPGERAIKYGRESPLLPIGERPRSAQPVPQTPSSAGGTSSKPGDPPGPEGLAPPHRSIFNRQRSGSTPDPITIVRDSKDLAAYNFAVSPGNASDSTPTSGGSEYMKQTFPETPSAFGNMWSSGPVPSPGMPNRELDDRSSQGSSRNSNAATLVQQVLLQRAATSVRGARHSRQASLGGRGHLNGQRAQSVLGSLVSENIVERPEGIREPELPSSLAPATHSSESLLAASTQSIVEEPRVDSNTSSTSFNSNVEQLGVPSPSVYSSVPTGTSQSSPQLAQSIRDSLFHGPATASSDSIVNASSTSDHQGPASHSSYSHREEDSPLHVPRQYHDSILESPMGSPFTSTFGSPPPYYTVVSDRDPPPMAGPNSSESYHETLPQQPSSGGSYQSAQPSVTEASYQEPFAATSASASPGTSTLPARQSERLSVNREGSSSGPSRRGRTRPQVPAGPRRPSQQINSYRARNASVSSTPISLTSARHRSFSTALSSPRFQTPAVKWRGFSMDAAKWTFTSAQLQAIVSRAIKRSGEATSIRLLHLETLDEEIPEELHRLEMQRTDVKTRYKMLTRRRAELLEIIAAFAEGHDSSESARAMQHIEDLRDVFSSLDRLAEELHSADEQIAQLNNLVEVHSASALAMALRKLNSSLLKEFSEAQVLRQRVEALEAERDEAWKQAENVAVEYDDLREKLQASEMEQSPDKRSSRVSASRKSSMRASKAGLRWSRSSTSSNHRISTSTLPSGAKSVFSINDVPPVPPIPRRPRDIVTDLPLRKSTVRSSAVRSSSSFYSDGTPDSDTRAMLRAHEELCEMLGITSGDIRSRRRHSINISSAAERPQSRPLSSNSSPPLEGPRQSSGRPTSLPGSSGLAEVYSAMTADRTAMLATLGMLSDQEA